MSNNKDQEKKTNLRSKLSLKKSNSDSTQSVFSANPRIINNLEKENETESCNISLSQDEFTSKSNDEDSLADFKSPKEKSLKRPIFNKFKIDAGKAKKKVLKSKSKVTKPIIEPNQPSIESTFFKPQTSNQNEVKESFPCPLCLKPFKDDITCTNHMKTCASKNNVSVQQLLDAKKLQERQAEERKSLGLLGAPVIPEKKKTYRSKNYSTGDDAQLQLVLAMSESLYEAERQNELEQAALLAGIPSECIQQMSEEERKSNNLQSFGFTTNKPAAENSKKQAKKKKLLGPTILQTRSREDKDRVLTERIACIITGDDALTQARQSSSTPQDRRPAVLKSKALRCIEQSRTRLWDKSRLTKIGNDYYVKELESHFLHQHAKKEPQEANLCSTEQPNEENQKENVSNVSIEYEPVDFELLINQKEDSDPPKMTMTENVNCEMDFVKHSNTNWLQTLNHSAVSDIIIFVKNNKHIFAHRLVLYVQCVDVLQYVEPNNSLTFPRIKEKLDWLLSDQISALAFLEFLYCGSISKYTGVFDQKDLLTQLEGLAKKYKVQRLIDYIEMKLNELKSESSRKKKEKIKKVNNQLNEDIRHKNPENTNSSNAVEQENKKLNIKSNISYEDYLLRHSKSNTRTHRNYLKKNQETQTPDSLETDIKSVSMVNQETQTCVELENLKINSTSTSSTMPYDDKIINKNQQTKTHNCVEELNPDLNVDPTPIKSPIKNHINRRFTTSPDLFDSEDDSMLTSTNQMINPDKTNPNSTNLNILVNLIDQDKYDDEVNILTQRIEKNKDQDNINDPEFSNSQKTIINLSISPSGESCKALSPTSSEDIHEIIPEQDYLRCKNNSNKIIKESRLIGDLNEDEDIISEIINNKNHPVRANTSTSHRSLRPHSSISEADVEIEIDDAEPDINMNESDDTMHNAVTPPRYNPCEFESRPKTDIDLFLNRIHKMNSKGALESDSESDASIPQPIEKRKNPFLKKNRDDSYRYLRDEVKNDQNVKVISMLEKEILEEEKKSENIKNRDLLKNCQIPDPLSNQISKSNINTNLQKSVIETVDLENEDIHCTQSPSCETIKNTRNDSSISTSFSDKEETILNEMSMYSKYKKNHQDNSIEKYRGELNFVKKKNSPEPKISNLKEKKSRNNNSTNSRCSTSKQVLLINKVSTTKSKIIKDGTSVCDSDNEKSNSPKLINHKYTEKSCYSNMKENNNKTNSSLNFQDSEINDSISSIDLVDDKITNCNVNSSSNIEPKNDFIDLSSDSDEENNSSFKNKFDSNLSKRKCKEKESYQALETKYNECDIEVEKILKLTSPELINLDVPAESRTFYGAEISHKKCDNQEHKRINSSPIPILSSDDEHDADKSNKKNKIFSNHKNDKTSGGGSYNSDRNDLELGSLENEWFNDITECDNWVVDQNNTSLKENKSLSINSNPLGNSKLKPPLENNQENLCLSPPHSGTSQNVKLPPSNTSPVLSQKRTNLKTKIGKKFQVKSVSSSDLEKFNTSTGCNLQKSSFETPKTSTLKQRSPDEDINLNNISLLPTPELNKELEKFGMKPQSREFCKKFLKHVYKNKSQESISKKRIPSENSSSEDEEPPLKKLHVQEKSKKDISKVTIQSKKALNSKTCLVIPEEMNYNDPDAANNLEDSVSIKDIFYGLVQTNKKLYNQVLTYEPLSLESLHLTFKQNGFKCKINSLMDFLDEQCITFQVQNGKNVNRRKKKVDV